MLNFDEQPIEIALWRDQSATGDKVVLKLQMSYLDECVFDDGRQDNSDSSST